jgi:hypothetical protein
MKTLPKEQFLKLLKKIVDFLEKKEVPYEIPMCYIDKEEFNYIEIIIPDTFDIQEILTHFKIHGDYKNQRQLLNCKIQGFCVNFIKVNITDLKLNFYARSWNFLPILISVLYKGLGLKYEKGILKMIFREKEYLVSRNLQDIFEFLGLNFKQIFGARLTPTKGMLMAHVMNSYFIHPDFFTEEIFQELDSMYEYNKEDYEEFLNNLEPFKDSDLFFNYQEELEDEGILNIVNDYFPEANILRKIKKVELLESLPESVIYREPKKVKKGIGWQDQLAGRISDLEKEIKTTKIKSKIFDRSLYDVDLEKMKDRYNDLFEEEGDNIRIKR